MENADCVARDHARTTLEEIARAEFEKVSSMVHALAEKGGFDRTPGFPELQQQCERVRKEFENACSLPHVLAEYAEKAKNLTKLFPAVSTDFITATQNQLFLLMHDLLVLAAKQS